MIQQKTCQRQARYVEGKHEASGRHAAGNHHQGRSRLRPMAHPLVMPLNHAGARAAAQVAARSRCTIAGHRCTKAEDGRRPLRPCTSMRRARVQRLPTLPTLPAKTSGAAGERRANILPAVLASTYSTTGSEFLLMEHCSRQSRQLQCGPSPASNKCACECKKLHPRLPEKGIRCESGTDAQRYWGTKLLAGKPQALANRPGSRSQGKPPFEVRP